MEPGWIVDGAYVEQRGEQGDIRFTVTTVPSDQHLSELWYVIPEIEYTQDFVGQFRSMDLATAVDMVLSDRMKGLERKGKLNVETAAIKMGLPGGRVIDQRDENNKIRLESTQTRHPIYKQALTLVVNALCYVSAYPDDIDSEWPEGTPKALLDKVENGQGKAIAKAKSKLTSMGYVPVHICGQHLVRKTHSMSKMDEHDSDRAIHWRRGHWRRQAYGPGRTLRKLIWLMPALIGAKEDETPDTGHLYLVDQPER